MRYCKPCAPSKCISIVFRFLDFYWKVGRVCLEFLLLRSCKTNVTFFARAPSTTSNSTFSCVNVIAMYCNNVVMTFFSDPGKLRYANNSNYKNDVMIRKEVWHNQLLNWTEFNTALVTVGLPFTNICSSVYL